MIVNPVLHQLCQAQMDLLIQSLGVTAGGVYWAESGEAERSPQWVPILVHPEHVWDNELPALSPEAPVISSGTSVPIDAQNALARFESGERGRIKKEAEIPKFEEWDSSEFDDNLGGEFSGDYGGAQTNKASQEAFREGSLSAMVTFSGHQERPNNYQLLRPLASEGTMLGLLVLERINRPWTLGEQKQVAQVVKTLEAGFLLVRRQQWIEASFAEREQFYEVQRDRLHDLLHQFKSPLTAIRTFGKLLLKRFQGDEKTTTVAGQVLRESDRLKGMLQNFSDVIDLDPDRQPTPGSSRPVAPLGLPAAPDREEEQDVPQPLALLPTSVSSGPFALGELLADLTETAKLLAREGNIHFEYNPIEALPQVIGDRTTLRETIGNVIDNALKYTPAGGQVRVQTAVAVPHCHRQWSELTNPVPGAVEDALLQRSPNSQRPQFQPHVMIHIKDSGLGISPEDLQQLFSRRFRGDKTNSDIPGTGLGLAIVRDTLEAIGGAIELFSPAIALEPFSITIGDHSCQTLAPTDINLSDGTSVILWLPLKEV
ncbi:MAG: sensor histidine kinase [Cyanophyceae cyanobacterium]